MATPSYLVSIPEASELLGVSIYYVKKAVNSGTLEGREFEGRNYVVRESVQKYIEATGTSNPNAVIDYKGIIHRYEATQWNGSKGPLKTLNERDGRKSDRYHYHTPNWADHMEIKKDRDGNTYWVCHPYGVGDDAFKDFVYLGENGWDVSIYHKSYYHELATMIQITEKANKKSAVTNALHGYPEA
jgi:hypothetical protein